KGLKEGLEYSVKIFEPTSLQAIEAEIRIGPKQNVDLLGRVAALTEVKVTFKAPGGGEIVTTDYVDDDLRMQKSVVPMMGTQPIEMVACTKGFALGENGVVELVDKMFIASTEPLNGIESAKSAVYYLKPSGQSTKLMIPSSDNQSVEQPKEGGVIVTVRPVAAPAGAKFPYEGKDSNALEAMKPTRFVQSDYNDIVELAKRAVGETKDAAEAVKRIESFVSKYIENRSLSVGYATAAEVAASKVGDCTEFAVLTAAMCRAIGIPARVVFGIVYVKAFAGRENVFGGHSWVEAYVGDKWIGLDATRALEGFGSGHIALAIGNGEPADFFNLAATLGQFKIDKVVIGDGNR
ncbi:MAG: transglutaminase-like domain-containing protein, partial [Sedimentisphaerales bacterium]